MWLTTDLACPLQLAFRSDALKMQEMLSNEQTREIAQAIMVIALAYSAPCSPQTPASALLAAAHARSPAIDTRA